LHKYPVILVAAVSWLILGLLGAGSARADLSFQVSTDTSSLSGQSGFLDFQFNPGDSSAIAATATVTDFSSVGGLLAPAAVLTDDAAGSLPGTLTLDNGTSFNDVFQGFTFGTSVSFTVTLSGPAISNPSGTVGSAFAFSLYATDGVTPLLTTDANGSVSTILLNATGTASAETFPQSTTDNAPVAIVTPAGVTPVPEPSSMVVVLLVSSLQAGCLLLRRRPREPSPQVESPDTASCGRSQTTQI
jgi:hypothetical protein